MTSSSNAEKLAVMLPSDDITSAVAIWTELLGVTPTFVDGDRWAQFDVNGSRLALAGADRVSDRAGVMIKVFDVTAARARAIKLGLEAGDLVEGHHEIRCSVCGPDGWPVVFYALRR
jgi:hypothetical protein